MSTKRNAKIRRLKQQGVADRAGARRHAYRLFPNGGKRTDRKIDALIAAFPDR